MRRWAIPALLALGLCEMAYGADDYHIQAGDVVNVSVWKEPELTGDLLVRPDGGISMPLAGDVDAAGHTAEEVRAAIDQKLRKFIPDPSVTVSVKQTYGNLIFIVGKVNKPGQYPVNRPIDVMQALSIAGGATPFASLNKIHILRRQDGKEVSMRFNYNDVQHGKRLAQNIVLQGGDTVVVP